MDTTSSDTAVSVLPKAGAEMWLRKGRKAVLLLHGFTGTPYEMKYLGKRLYGEGYSVYIPRYPGHGTSLREMARTSFAQWHAAAREAFLELRSLRPEVYIAGLSMGGIFTVLLAAEFGVKKIALLATPCTLKEKIIYITPFLGLFKRIWWQADPGKGLLSEKARAEHVCYDQGVPVRQSWQLFRAIGKAMRSLPRVTADALLVQSSLDPVIPAHSMDYIYGRIGSKNKKSVMLQRSGHSITVDFEKARVAGLVIRFFGDRPS